VRRLTGFALIALATAWLPALAQASLWEVWEDSLPFHINGGDDGDDGNDTTGAVLGGVNLNVVPGDLVDYIGANCCDASTQDVLVFKVRVDDGELLKVSTMVESYINVGAGIDPGTGVDPDSLSGVGSMVARFIFSPSVNGPAMTSILAVAFPLGTLQNMDEVWFKLFGSGGDGVVSSGDDDDDESFDEVHGTIHAVPEPRILAMLALGLLGFGLRNRSLHNH
jgi:hypothetical protein